MTAHAHLVVRGRTARTAAATGSPGEASPDGRYLIRVDRTTIMLACVGLALLIAVAVLVTLLATRSASGSSGAGAPARDGPTVTLSGPDIAAYIGNSYGDAGVTCPTAPTVVGASLVCSDPEGGRFTVTILNARGAYTVRPN